LTHKPLYSIGAGELGSMAEVAEPVLRQIFDRATEWGAVLLLDEADLFLTKRTQKDMKRNAFVTIFLRQLEYYQGILFLTSNRIEGFDPAFASRIHLKARFTASTVETRAAIWKNLLVTVEGCQGWGQDVFDRLGNDLDLNGREIKNLIRPALTVATYEGVPLSKEIIRLIYVTLKPLYASAPSTLSFFSASYLYRN
jgi:SpoVK/Ycf46/Vps4 family AAA+-type ATPase